MTRRESLVDRYLEMKAISKNFPGVKALQSVDFGVDEGEVVALVGENGAGKSTLMNILGGVVRRDSGEIWLSGKEAGINTVIDAQREKIAFIHQELSLFNQLSVQENLFIDNLKAVKSSVPFIISKKIMRERTESIFKELDIHIDPATKVGKIPMHEQQMVEIASAVLKNAKIIILDEPTTSLANKERDKLYEIIKRLKQEQKIVIYITHEIENAINISDRVVCLRDGHNAGEKRSEGLTKSEVVSMMIGSKAGKAFLKTEREIKDESILEFRNIKTATKLNGVNISLKKGEVLGLYGLVGSGRTELIRALYGIDKITGGDIFIDGKNIKKPSPIVLKEMGLAWLTENRRDEGLFLELGINFNISITGLERFAEGPFAVMNSQKEAIVVQDSIDKFQISTPSMYQPAGKLSGGNQQKVVIAKWLHRDPRLFILDEPTRGIDVHAKEEIYRWIDQIANEGVSIILISSEIEEIIGMSDRVITMSKGRVVSELKGDEITSSNIIRYSMS
jgi:ribose transport system ATP-binding protein